MCRPCCGEGPGRYQPHGCSTVGGPGGDVQRDVEELADLVHLDDQSPGERRVRDLRAAGMRAVFALSEIQILTSKQSRTRVPACRPCSGRDPGR